MNLRQLNYFTRIVDAQNMTRAAEMLHIAQPALSQQIMLLEEELGVKLLNRTARGMLATEEGELLYQHARAILRQVDNTRALISRKQGVVSGTVSIGMASSTAKMLALHLIQRVRERHPAIVLEIVDVPSADLTKLVLQGRVDFSLSPDQRPLNGLVHEPLLHEELLLLTPPSWPLRPGKQTIADIARMPLVLPSLPNTLRARVDHAFLTAGHTTNLYAEASTSAILIPAVRMGAAATILPYSAAYTEISGGTIKAHSTDIPLSRELAMCASNSLPLTPAVERVMEFCKDEIRRLIREGIWMECRALF